MSNQKLLGQSVYGIRNLEVGKSLWWYFTETKRKSIGSQNNGQAWCFSSWCSNRLCCFPFPLNSVGLSSLQLINVACSLLLNTETPIQSFNNLSACKEKDPDERGQGVGQVSKELKPIHKNDQSDRSGLSGGLWHLFFCSESVFVHMAWSDWVSVPMPSSLQLGRPWESTRMQKKSIYPIQTVKAVI